MAFARIEHAGGAAISALQTDIGSGDTSLTLTVSTNWPTGGVGPFYLVIDQGLSGEEKILATARSSNSLTGLTRGVDGTSASAHSAGAVIKHIFTAVEADEANQTAHGTLGAVTTKGDLLVGSASQALARLGVGSDGLPLVANSGATNGLNYAALAAVALAAQSVTAAKIAAAALDQSTIAGGNGTALHVPTGGITTLEILDGTILTADIALLQITTALIAAGAVTAAKIGTLPTCLVTNSADQGVNDSTPTALAFDTETFDATNMHSTGGNSGRITFTTPGVYQVGGNARFAQNNTGYRQLQIELNGTTPIASSNDTVFVTTGSDVAVSTLVKVAAADYIRLIAFQNSGGSLNVSNVGVWSPQFWAHFVSAG